MTAPSRIASLALRIASWAPAAVAAAVFVLLTGYYRFHLSDDGFIYFRYAANLASGHGPVWNVGEAPVEGYSSPLWLGLLAAGMALGSDVVTWSRWLGFLAAAGALIGVWVLARRLGAGIALAGTATLLAALVKGLYYWAPVGLETPLDTALLVWTCAGVADSRRGSAWLVPVALLGIARPEGPFLVVLALAAIAIARGWRAVTWREAAIAVAPAALWLAFRWGYYGVPLPNTYYAKATGPRAQQLRLGLHYGGWLVVPLAIAAAWTLRSPRRPVLAILLLIAGQLALTVAGGGDWMSNHRLLLPVVLPLLGCSAAFASSSEVRGGVLPALLVAALTTSHVRASGRTLLAALRGQTLPHQLWQEGTLVHSSRGAADWIARHYPAGTTIAVNHAGVVPNGLLGFTAIDMTGLNDAHIARDVPGGLHEKFDPDYVLGRKPRLILLNSLTMPGQDGIWYHQGYWDGETALVNRAEFKRFYRPVRYWERIGRGGSPDFILLYERVPEPAR